MDTPLRERIEDEMITALGHDYDDQVVDIAMRHIDQEATKRVVEALEGLKIEILPIDLGENELWQAHRDGATRMAEVQNAKIDAAIKQAKGAHNE